jgi:hypothetical protein
MAVVDQYVPFYKLPNGSPAPGEASGVIKPGDILTHINGSDLSTYSFSDVVETLRNLGTGQITLTFRSPQYLPLTRNENLYINAMEDSRYTTLEDKIKTLEQDLDRERKCRQLADKKLHMYREEILRLSQVNLSLLFQKAKAEEKVKSAHEFINRTQIML